jgi:biopolymer transport protein ExbB
MTPLLASAATPPRLDNLFDLVVAGGPVMWPLGICSVVALAFAVERSIRMRRGKLGSRHLGAAIAQATRDGGATSAIAACEQKGRGTALSRILAAGLARDGEGLEQVERAVEDAGAREAKRLASSLRPLATVVTIAPLLGLLGTVWGMIEAFSNIAMKQGMGKPELLASGISQALVTTVAGLVIAIPTQAAYFWFKGRIDRFVRDVEDTFAEVAQALRGAR